MTEPHRKRDLYMRTVYERTEAWLGQLERDQLDRAIVPRPFPPVVANTFSARVAGDQGITMLDAIECSLLLRKYW